MIGHSSSTSLIPKLPAYEPNKGTLSKEEIKNIQLTQPDYNKETIEKFLIH